MKKILLTCCLLYNVIIANSYISEIVNNTNGSLTIKYISANYIKIDQYTSLINKQNMPIRSSSVYQQLTIAPKTKVLLSNAFIPTYEFDNSQYNKYGIHLTLLPYHNSTFTNDLYKHESQLCACCNNKKRDMRSTELKCKPLGIIRQRKNFIEFVHHSLHFAHLNDFVIVSQDDINDKENYILEINQKTDELFTKDEIIFSVPLHAVDIIIKKSK